MEPFVFLDDARPGGASRLYRAPAETVTAWTPAEVAPALERVRGARARGLHAAGFLSYEAAGTAMLLIFGAAMTFFMWVLVPTFDHEGNTAPIDPDFELPED